MISDIATISLLVMLELFALHIYRMIKTREPKNEEADAIYFAHLIPVVFWTIGTLLVVLTPLGSWAQETLTNAGCVAFLILLLGPTAGFYAATLTRLLVIKRESYTNRVAEEV